MKKILDTPAGKASQSSEPFMNLIIQVAKQMGAVIVIEEVKSEEQLKTMMKKDVHIYQGCYFSKPIYRNKIFEFVEKCEKK